MNNFGNSIKRFLKNKNTVTIIGVIAIIAILYFGYKWRIKQAIDPITNIPMAAVDIQPRSRITSDMIETVDIAPIMLRDNVIRTAGEVIGKYSNYNTMIPAGSLFYRGVVVNEGDLPNSSLINVKEGEILYNFPVNIDTTYGNSIMPNSIIDIYMKAVDTDGKIMVGKLLENIEVLAVKDSSGKNVFENTAEERVPAYLFFGLSPDLNILLRKTSYMGSFSVELFPVPMGQTLDTDADVIVSTQYLRDFIEANTVTISEEEITNDETTNNTGDNDTNNDQNAQG